MVLSVAERKHRMPYGAQKEIAETEGVSVTYVSLAVSGEMRPKTQDAKVKLRRVQEAVADKIGLTVEETFNSRELVVLAVSV